MNRLSLILAGGIAGNASGGLPAHSPTIPVPSVIVNVPPMPKAPIRLTESPPKVVLVSPNRIQMEVFVKIPQGVSATTLEGILQNYQDRISRPIRPTVNQ